LSAAVVITIEEQIERDRAGDIPLPRHSGNDRARDRSRALIVRMPPMLAYRIVHLLGWIVVDVINTLMKSRA
jgi:hypothetical protein